MYICTYIHNNIYIHTYIHNNIYIIIGTFPIWIHLIVCKSIVKTLPLSKAGGFTFYFSEKLKSSKYEPFNFLLDNTLISLTIITFPLFFQAQKKEHISLANPTTFFSRVILFVLSLTLLHWIFFLFSIFTLSFSIYSFLSVCRLTFVCSEDRTPPFLQFFCALKLPLNLFL